MYFEFLEFDAIVGEQARLLLVNILSTDQIRHQGDIIRKQMTEMALAKDREETIRVEFEVCVALCIESKTLSLRICRRSKRTRSERKCLSSSRLDMMRERFRLCT